MPGGLTYDELFANRKLLTPTHEVDPRKIYGMLTPNGAEPALLSMGLTLSGTPEKKLGKPQCVAALGSGELKFDYHCAPWCQYTVRPGEGDYVAEEGHYVLWTPEGYNPRNHHSPDDHVRPHPFVLVEATMLYHVRPTVFPVCHTCDPRAHDSFIALTRLHRAVALS